MSNEYKLDPIHFDQPYSEVYAAAVSYLSREEVQWTLTSKFEGDGGFTLDAVRRSNFISSESKATFHGTGVQEPEGGTSLILTVTINDTLERTVESVRTPIDINIHRILDGPETIPDPTIKKGTITEKLDEKTHGKGNILVFLVALILIMGVMPTSCNRGWF